MPSDYGHEFADKELKKLESKLTKEYKQAAKEVEKKMKDFLSKFEEKDKKMLAKVQSGEMTAKEYAEWRKGQIMTGKRWEDMRDTLAQDLVNADKIAAGMINDSLPNAYAENMNFGTYEVESGVNIDTGFTLYDRKTVENLMKKDPQIIPQARIDIPKDELWNQKKLTSAVIQGILQGESIPNIAKRLRSVADMDRNAAIRNARTYTTAAENKGRVDSYERANDMGIPVKQMWMATLDDRTRVEHRHLDGQVREIGEDFEADGYKIRYPGDPSAEPEMIYNCRCTLVADLPKYGKDLERNESKLGDMTYEEWKYAKDKENAKQDAEIRAEQEPKEKSFAESDIKENNGFTQNEIEDWIDGDGYARFGEYAKEEESIDYTKLTMDQKDDVTDIIESGNGDNLKKEIEFLIANTRTWKNVKYEDILEKGVSCFKTKNGYPVLENLTQAQSMAVRIGKNYYGITGDVIGKGHDDEPLLKNTKNILVNYDEKSMKDTLIECLKNNFENSSGEIDYEDSNQIYKFGDKIMYAGITFTEPKNKEWADFI